MIRNEKAWSILMEDEKLALTLKHGHGKSTWEAGEIMAKAHYKFLEIEARAKKFMKMFTEYFEMFDELVPPSMRIEPRVRKYLELTIGKRMPIAEVLVEIGDTVFSMMSFRERIITNEMVRLMKVEKLSYRSFATMVMEFDRWNNFRILPRDIQEPSAFKRRNKKNDLKNIKNIWDLNPLIVDLLRERYTMPKDYSGRVLYVPMPSQCISKEEYLFITKFSEKSIKEFSKLGLYVFSKKIHAEEFLDIIVKYRGLKLRSPREGLKFWPIFRVSTKNALNYNEIQKKIASRKFLEMALKDLDIKIAKPVRTSEPIY